MLEAQKVIEEIEAEASKFLPKATIECLRSRSYGIDDGSSLDGRFIVSISNVLRAPSQD